MSTQQAPRQLPKIKFRVLIIGRANAGKTSILQRVCDTTDSPVIYRRNGWEEEPIQLDPSMDRGEHKIDDEIIFSNHKGYVFHDSRGFESGGVNELEIVQNFVQQKSGEPRLASRLHAIWYCVPMDNQRPGLDLKHFKDICPDQNVPVIAVFTKYDQFKLDVEMDLEDGDVNGAETTPEIQFEENYLCHLGARAKYVRLEKMHKPDGCCKELIEETARVLNDNVVTLMLVAVQRSNVELSVKLAVERTLPHLRSDAEDIMSMTITKQFSSGTPGCYLMTVIIILLKHATTLRPSGLSSQSALSQAHLDCQKLNIGPKIIQHFTEPPQNYSVQDFVDFIMGVMVGLLLHYQDNI
ncbi:hypothetical protein D9756_006983 [Leucocoprinus leucothites]|uniref:G domain-containing protein n=1 Tax=Leucocoprinus leucothites TaxID=201217 RepID=A0A8H5FY45_9AGAR|nr:hypothetical protein D9756_006983 [Leucoagaricus leucothites]